MRVERDRIEMIRRLRLGNLRKLLRDRNGPILPDDDAGREYLVELLLAISLGPHAEIKMPNAIEVWAPWMDKYEGGAIIDQIKLMPIWDRKPTARVLGERLQVTNGERERLKLWTIAPCDMGKRGMVWWRKLKDRERKRRLRKLQGRQSRIAYLAKHTTSKEQPWKREGISRRTWYYRLKQADCTSPSGVKLLTVTEQPVQPQQKRQVSKKKSAEKKPSTIKSQPTPQSQKPERQVTDTVGTVTVREINGITCAITDTAMINGYACLRTEQPVFGIGHNAGPPLHEQDLRGMPQDMSWYYKLTAAAD